MSRSPRHLSPTTLRYNRLDITGAATGAGSYAFLKTGGDATSAIAHFDYAYSGTVELRLHPTDASGTSRAAFYDTVAVGDSFDYRTNGLDCAFRFKVTRVGARANPLTLGMEYVRGYGGRCGGPVDDPGAAKDVYFVWKVRGGIPAPDGIRVLLYGEPVGEGTYRLAGQVPYVIDVPASSVIVSDGIIEHEPQPDDSGRPSAISALIRRRDDFGAPHRPGDRQGSSSLHKLGRRRRLVRPDHGVDPARGVGSARRRPDNRRPHPPRLTHPPWRGRQCRDA